MTVPNSGQHVDTPLQRLRTKVLFYNPSFFQLSRNIMKMKNIYANCEINSCEMTFDKKDVNRSDAVIIYHRGIRLPAFSRPTGQIWIMIQHEASITYGDSYSALYKVKRKYIIK